MFSVDTSNTANTNESNIHRYVNNNNDNGDYSCVSSISEYNYSSISYDNGNESMSEIASSSDDADPEDETLVESASSSGVIERDDDDDFFKVPVANIFSEKEYVNVESVHLELERIKSNVNNNKETVFNYIGNFIAESNILYAELREYLKILVLQNNDKENNGYFSYISPNSLPLIGYEILRVENICMMIVKTSDMFNLELKFNYSNNHISEKCDITKICNYIDIFLNKISLIKLNIRMYLHSLRRQLTLSNKHNIIVTEESDIKNDIIRFENFLTMLQTYENIIAYEIYKD